MKDRVIVRLQVTSEHLSLDDIATTMKISADRKWEIGEKVSSSALTRKANGWELHSGLGEEFSVHAQLDALFRKIAIAKDSLSELKERATIVVSCVIYCSSQPDLYLEPHLLRSISSINNLF
jgi:hypothetical protein